jgi:hypothetical protein
VPAALLLVENKMTTATVKYDEQKVIEAKHRAYVTRLQKEDPSAQPMSLNDFAEEFKASEQDNAIEVTPAIRQIAARHGFLVVDYTKQKGQTKGKTNVYLDNKAAKISGGFLLMNVGALKNAKSRMELNLAVIDDLLNEIA